MIQEDYFGDKVQNWLEGKTGGRGIIQEASAVPGMKLVVAS